MSKRQIMKIRLTQQSAQLGIVAIVDAAVATYFTSVYDLFLRVSIRPTFFSRGE